MRLAECEPFLRKNSLAVAAGEQVLTATLLATGEIKLTRPPRVNGGKTGSGALLDYKREFQETLKDGWWATTPRERFVDDRPPVGWGSMSRPTKFGARAKQVIKEGGTCLDSIFGKNVVFLTWTLPGDSEELFDRACEHSSRFVQDVCQWVRDMAGCSMYLWVYEFQSRGALHFHMCAGVDNAERLHRLMSAFPQRMRRLFVKWSRETGVNFFRNSRTGKLNIRNSLYGQRAEQAHTSVAHYLCKYMSKHVTKHGGSSARHPARWWRCSKQLNAVIKSRRERIRITGSATELDRILNSLAERAQLTGARLVAYANARFPWLRTIRVWSQAPESGRFRWSMLKQWAQGELTKGCRVLMPPGDAVESTAPAAAPERQPVTWETVCAVLNGRRMLAPAPA